LNAKTSQRSLHMDDEVFAILTEAAAERRMTRSALLRTLILDHLRGAATSLPVVPAASSPPADPPRPARAEPAAGASSILPDPAIGSFTVAGGKVRGRRLKSDRETGGLEPQGGGGFALD